MKKVKIVTIVVLVVAVCSLCGFCSYRCSHRNIDYRSKANKELKINIPEEWECIYHNRGTCFNGEGAEYYVFQTNERDEEFFKDFSAIPDTEFEEEVIEEKRINFDEGIHLDKHMYIDSEYLFDFSEPYEWYQKDVRVPKNELVTCLRKVYMIYQSERLYIFADHFKVTPTPDELESLSSSENQIKKAKTRLKRGLFSLKP